MRSRSPHTQEVTYTPPPLHELEGEVMEEVWHRGEASVREIMMALNVAAPRERAYTPT
jgi:predicted transcriptional regulator